MASRQERLVAATAESPAIARHERLIEVRTIETDRSGRVGSSLNLYRPLDPRLESPFGHTIRNDLALLGQPQSDADKATIRYIEVRPVTSPRPSWLEVIGIQKERPGLKDSADRNCNPCQPGLLVARAVEHHGVARVLGPFPCARARNENGEGRGRWGRNRDDGVACPHRRCCNYNPYV